MIIPPFYASKYINERKQLVSRWTRLGWLVALSVEKVVEAEYIYNVKDVSELVHSSFI